MEFSKRFSMMYDYMEDFYHLVVDDILSCLFSGLLPKQVCSDGDGTGFARLTDWDGY